MKDVVKEYSNGEVTIVWKPALCIHSTRCWKGLPLVFSPQKRPWVNPNGAITPDIIKQVDQCPSGALSYYMNNKEIEMEQNKENGCCTAQAMHNGPLVVKGCVCVKKDGEEDRRHDGTVAFCRCSKSKNQPYCDGSHMKHPFE